MISNQTYVLITGGAGYIGSHIALECLLENMSVIVYDNLSNSTVDSLYRVKMITGKMPIFVQGCIQDKNCLSRVFAEYSIRAVLHLAGLKSVGESLQDPIRYYNTNVGGILNLLQVMKEHDVFCMVFSSSATVYGEPKQDRISETHPLRTLNPYGASKLMSEDILRDVCASDDRFNVSMLRYFNPAGNHSSGLIGEEPSGLPNNLFPVVLRSIGGSVPISVFGNDYDTPDGTGVRDYIHVVDLAKGHIAALKHLFTTQAGWRVFNMGTGEGYSVLQIISTMERVSNSLIPFKIIERRPGDAGKVVADPSLVEEVLGWKATITLEDMCADAWKYYRNRKKLRLDANNKQV